MHSLECYYSGCEILWTTKSKIANIRVKVIVKVEVVDICITSKAFLTAYGIVSGGGQLPVDFRGLRSFVVDVTICRVSATALLCR